jgi:hypothetical protein
MRNRLTLYVKFDARTGPSLGVFADLGTFPRRHRNLQDQLSTLNFGSQQSQNCLMKDRLYNEFVSARNCYTYYSSHFPIMTECPSRTTTIWHCVVK